MFGLFGSSQPKMMALTLHQLCHVVRHADYVFGGGLGMLRAEIHLISETKPTRPDDPHIFLMGGPFEGFRFMYFQDQSIQIYAGGWYTGFGLMTGKRTTPIACSSDSP